MNKHEKLRLTILAGNADANIDFASLCRMLEHFGFVLHIRGDHHIFAHPHVPDLLNLQPVKRHAKAYQVQQVRAVLKQHPL